MENSKTKSWFRKTDAVVAAFVIPVVIMLIIFVQREIFPFGDKTFLRTDMYHQYAPFFSEFQYKLQTGGSLLHSWNVGLGVNFSALYAYYLASPLNWLIIFIPKSYIIEFMTVMIVIKTGLAGLTMTAYLNKHAENLTLSTAFFGIFYALSGYMAAYSWNIMWLDCIVLFPLILLGVEKIVNEKKGLLYVITLAVCIASNYYISIMICAFLCIYLIMVFITSDNKRLSDICLSLLIFAGYSILAGALAAGVLLPAVFALKSTASGDITFPTVVTQYFSIIDMFARHMVCVETEQALDHWPNIYCGVAVFLFGFLYFANSKIKLREKIVYGAVAVFFLASFSLNILNFVWHGLHYPNSLPARQSFIYIFLLLYMSFRTLDEFDGNSFVHLGIATGISLAFIIFCQKVVTDDAFDWSVFYITMGFVAAYALGLYLYKAGRININILMFVMMIIVAIEAAINLSTTSITVTSRSAYVKDNVAVESVVQSVADETDFYRFEKETRKTKDEGAWLNFPSVSIFSSTTRKSVGDFLNNLGCEASVNSYSITGSTPLVDALLDVKYTITTGKSDDESKTLISGYEDTYLYKNKYCLPVGFVIPDGLESEWSLDADNAICVQNELCDILAAPQVLREADGYKTGSIYSTTIEEDGLYYGYLADKQVDKVKVTINGTEKTFEHTNRGYLLELGILHKNDIVDFEAVDETSTSVEVYRFDYDALGRLVENLGKETLKVNHYTDTRIDGNIDMENAGTLLLSIPYEKGWTVYVDGNVHEIRTLWDAFIGIDLEAGSHDISLRYNPEGLKTGLIVSAGAGLILFIIIIISLITHFIKLKKEEKADEEALLAHIEQARKEKEEKLNEEIL